MLWKGKSGGVRWLIVFLGNPGAKYAASRHNVGFMTGDAVGERCGVRISRLRSGALTARCELGGESVLLAKPQTYMNLSGDAVGPLAAFYRVPPERILVVSDEVNLPVGKLRLRRSGSAGGHNGLKSIIAALGTDGFPRLRLGVGAPPHPDYDMADWVLSGFRGRDAEDMAAAVARAAEAVECYIKEGADAAMNRYNG
jgi:PTH1 family peptidyl-tRNA hydrolase